MRKLLFWPYQIYAWLVFIPFACIFSLMCGWMAVAVAVVVSPRFSSRYVASPWARVVAWLTPVRVEVSGLDNLDPARSCVVVCNHVSQYDILVIYGWLPLDLRWVIKMELRKVPGIGIGCEKVGHIFIDRQRPEQAQRAVNEALQRMGEGIAILFFPEGTRSRDGRLLPFKKGAFRIAADHNLPVLPLTVLGTRDILPAKTLRLFPGRARLVIHPLIEPAGKQVPELMAEARHAIASALPGQAHTR